MRTKHLAKTRLTLSAVPLVIMLLAMFAGIPAGALAGSPYNGADGVVDTGITPKNDLATGTGDDSFGQGTHEDTAVPTVVSGSIPNNKADLLSFWVDTAKVAGSDYLYLAWLRVDNPSGSTDMDFEFNQSRTISSNGVTPVRTVGDLLITYEITNGGTAVDLSYRTWEGTEWSDPLSLGAFSEGSFNALVDGNKTYHTFGEAAINLTTGGLFPANTCVNFGSAYLKSRAAPSFPSELKDFIAPTPIEVSNCGSITIEKDTVPNDEQNFGFTTTGTGLSFFTLDDDSNATLPNTKTFVNLQPGSYSVTETAQANFPLTDLDCTATGGSSGSWTADTTTAAITITAGGTVRCKFTNTAVPAELTVIKHVINNNGGTAVASDFPIEVDGTNVSDASFDGVESPGTTVTLSRGSYSVTETTEPRYAGTYGSGCSGTVTWGDQKTCLITNNDAPPGLTVIKHVINNDGGTADAGDFEITVTGGNPDPASFPGDEDGTEVAISAGSYSVVENTVDEYAVTYSSGCTSTIELGQSKTCTVTNNDVEPKLIVKKTVINDNGGTKGPSDFTINVSAAGPDPNSFTGSATGTEVGINAGDYEVTEDEDSGYAATLSADCGGSIDIGETKTCEIVNDDIQPKITVTKVVVNDNGGTKKPADFTMEVDGENATPGSFDGSSTGTEVALDAGSYFVGESGDEGYIAGYSEGCDGTIDIGETAECTVTNDDAPPGLTVVKRVVNDNGGTATADDFTMNIEADNADPQSFPGDEEGTHVDLDAGEYSVTEDEVAGYEAGYSQECEGSIGLGETVVCTVTNDDVAPELTVIKSVVNNSGGLKKSSDFTLSVDGEGPDPASFPGSAAGTTVSLSAGDYKVSETKVDGYTGSFSADCTGSIGIGQTKTCTVTNNDDPPVEVLGEQVVNILGIELPRTGLNSPLILAIGLFLPALGAYLLRLSSRRQTAS